MMTWQYFIKTIIASRPIIMLRLPVVPNHISVQYYSKKMKKKNYQQLTIFNKNSYEESSLKI